MTLVSSSASLSLAGQLLVGQTNKFCLHLVITDLMVGGYSEHIRFAFTHEGCFVGFPQLQYLVVLAVRGDVRPGGVHGGDRRRRAEEGDGCRVFLRLVFNPALALENAEDVVLGRDEDDIDDKELAR